MVVLVYAVYHPQKGILLGATRDGGCIWSLKHPGLTGKELAPTFGDREQLAKWIADNSVKDFLEGVELRQVFPSREGKMATIEDCSEALLPRWGEGKWTN